MEIKLVCSTGEVRVKPGDKFKDDDLEWEIIGPAGTTSYSPSSLGSTPDMICKPLGQIPSWFQQYASDNGTVVWCGDSIAAKMLTVTDGKKRDARGDALTK